MDVKRPEVLDNDSILNMNKLLTDNQINQWRQNGFLLINNLFDNNLVKCAIQELKDFVSTSKNDFCNLGNYYYIVNGLIYIFHI